jgi:hypothetical protein
LKVNNHLRSQWARFISALKGRVFSSPMDKELKNIAKELLEIASQLIHVFHTSVILPIKNITHWVWKTVIIPICTWSWEVVIYPILTKIGEGIKYLYENFAKAVDKLFEIAEQLSEIFHTFVVAPLKNMTLWTWKAILVPVGEKVIQALDWTRDVLIKIAKTMNHYILSPLLCRLGKLCKWSWTIFTKIAEWLRDTLVKILREIFNQVLNPLFQVVVKTTKCLWKRVIVPIAQGIGKLCTWLGTHLLNILGEIFNRIVKPIGKAVVATAKTLWKWVVAPLFRKAWQLSEDLFSLVIKTANTIYNYVFKPTGQFIAHATSLLFQATVATAKNGMTSIYETYVWLTKKQV